MQEWRTSVYKPISSTSVTEMTYAAKILKYLAPNNTPGDNTILFVTWSDLSRVSRTLTVQSVKGD